VVEVGITDSGKALLAKMDSEVAEMHGRVARHLDSEELRMLSSLLERLRADQVA
jgi:DNA-binding MarR family transcriptional regulator